MAISENSRLGRALKRTEAMARTLRQHAKAIRAHRAETAKLPPDELTRHDLLEIRRSYIQNLKQFESIERSVVVAIRRMLEVIKDDHSNS